MKGIEEDDYMRIEGVDDFINQLGLMQKAAEDQDFSIAYLSSLTKLFTCDEID
jgi:hypothetical protein